VFVSICAANPRPLVAAITSAASAAAENITVKTRPRARPMSTSPKINRIKVLSSKPRIARRSTFGIKKKATDKIVTNLTWLGIDIEPYRGAAIKNAPILNDDKRRVRNHSTAFGKSVEDMFTGISRTLTLC